MTVSGDDIASVTENPDSAAISGSIPPPCGERRFVGQEVGAHRRPLGTLTREHPHRAVVALARPRARRAPRRRLPRARRRPARRGCRPDDRADQPVRASTRQRVGQIRQLRGVIGVAETLDPVGQAARGPAQLLDRRGGQREQPCAGDSVSRGSSTWSTGACSRNGVHVGAREAVRRHRRTTGMVAVGRPRRRLFRHEEIGLDLGHLFGQRGEVQVLGHRRVLQREDGLHQPESTRRGLAVAEVGLRRARGARALGAVDLGEAGELDRVADGGAGAVGLDHADVAGSTPPAARAAS